MVFTCSYLWKGIAIWLGIGVWAMLISNSVYINKLCQPWPEV